MSSTIVGSPATNERSSVDWLAVAFGRYDLLHLQVWSQRGGRTDSLASCSH